MPVGKLPQERLAALLARIRSTDSRVVLGPGIGLDCAVIDGGARLAVYKSDPVTFATDEIGYYVVHVNANDIATTGARPLWFLVTLLLPQGKSTPELVEVIMDQIADACRDLQIGIIGGHTEITVALDRPIAVGTMIGEVTRRELISPRGARAGDHVLLTKGVPIEATALLAREFPERLRRTLTEIELAEARDFLYRPGISVTRDARVAIRAGRVTAMHDPTEGGVRTALWELAEASGQTLQIDPQRIPVPELARRVCDAFDIEPFAAIASGSLLVTAAASDANAICSALSREAIGCSDIGIVRDGPAIVEQRTATGFQLWPRTPVDAITSAFGNQ